MNLGSFFKPKDLWSAASRGDVESILQLVAAGRDVNQRRRSLDLEGVAPLHLAAINGKVDAINALVKLGADVNATDDWGRTPLMSATAEWLQADAVESLLSLGAGIDRQDKHGFTALDWAAYKGNEVLTALLLKHGANPNVTRGAKVSSPVCQCIEGNNIKVLTLLVNANASVNTPSGGRTPLSTASIDGKEAFVRALLLAGANVNDLDSNGFTPLMSAVRGRHVTIVKDLIDSRANLDLVNNLGETALNLAKDEGCREIIDILLAAGAQSRDLG